MELETASIDDIAAELRERYEGYVLAYTRSVKNDDARSTFNFVYGGTPGGVHAALGLLEATRATLVAEEFGPREIDDD